MLKNNQEILKARSLGKIPLQKFKIGVLGIPTNCGQPKQGVERGPEAIRDGGLIKIIEKKIPYAEVCDYGDVKFKLDPAINTHPKAKNLPEVISWCKESSKAVEEVLQEGRFCINLGGDHSAAIGTIFGHLKASNDNVALLWVDAHADINVPDTSPTGNIHGMPVSILCKELQKYWPNIEGVDWFRPNFSFKNLAYIGLRDVNKSERLFLEEFGITYFSSDDIDKYGIEAVTQLALNRIDPKKNRSIHLSYDIDSIDPVEAPSTGTAVKGGMTLREGARVAEMTYETGRLSCIDLVEVNPFLGSEEDKNMTVDAAIRIILAACGHSRIGCKVPDDLKLPPVYDNYLTKN